MKCLLISDKESPKLTASYFKKYLSDIDCVISCGDLKSSYLEYIATLTNKPVFYVHGNHDDHYLTKPPLGCQSIEDKIILFKGLRIMGFGGCRRYDESINQYTDFQMWLRYIKKLPKLFLYGSIDVLVTHSPAYGLGDQPERFVHKGFKAFNHILSRFKPSFHFHGHNHLNYGSQKRSLTFDQTTIINAFDCYVIEIPDRDKA